VTTTLGDRQSPLTGIRYVSIPLLNFEFAIEDAERLLKLHDSETQRQRGRPSRQVEVFKRAAIILSITAWESFIEDTIRVCAEKQIRTATSPADVQRTFNSVAEAWLQRSPKAPHLAGWAGDGWKSLIREKLDSDLRKLNTPNTKNVRDLSKCYLSTDITAHWSWTRTSAPRAAERLDKLIELRGDLAHRGPELFRSASVRRSQAADAVQLLKKLVYCTEKCLGVGPRPVSA
jgi:hypothetical protein